MGTRKLRIVVGTQLRANVNFWNSASGRNVEGVDALMVSFGEIANRASVLQAASREGLRKYLGFKGDIFLDNGCYAIDLPPFFAHGIIRHFLHSGLRLRTAEPVKRSRRPQPPSSL